METTDRSSLRPSPARAGEGRLAFVLALLGTIVFGFVVPGLGVVIAGALSLAVYRGDRRAQVTLLAAGVVVTALALVAWALVLGGETTLEPGRPIPLRP